MAYWIFVSTDYREAGERVSSERIFETHIKDKLWGLVPNVANRKRVAPGDVALFYLGTPHKAFAGIAKLRSGFVRFSDAEQTELARKGILEAEAGVWLDDAVVWQQRLPISGLIPKLEFIQNKEYWSCHLRNAIVSIPEGDFGTICEALENLATEMP